MSKYEININISKNKYNLTSNQKSIKIIDIG